MKKKWVWRKSAWRQSSQVPMSGAQWKATVISCTLFSLFLVLAGSWVALKAIERQEEVHFAPTVKFEQPKVPPKKPRMNQPQRSQPNIASDYSESAELIAQVGELSDGVGIFSNGEGYEMLAEMPQNDVMMDDSISDGLFSRQRESRLGGSWDRLDASGRPLVTREERPAQPRKDAPPLTLYAVIFRITADHEGKLVDFELERVVDPRTQPNEVVEVNIPEHYIQQARTQTASYEYEASGSADELIELYDYYFYCPQYPNRVILPPPSDET